MFPRLYSYLSIFLLADEILNILKHIHSVSLSKSGNLLLTGKDATDDFEQVGHSVSAKEMMNKYSVGRIDSSTIPAKKAHTPPKQPHETDESTMKILQFLIPLMIIGLALGIHFYLKST